jgi:D-alanine-D-alanine ligase
MEETAEFDKQETVDALESALRLMGYETELIGNAFQLIEALAAGKKMGSGIQHS